MKIFTYIILIFLPFLSVGQSVNSLKDLVSKSIEKEDYSGAISNLNRAIKIAPKDYTLLSARAYCYEKLNKIDLALKDNFEVLKYDKSGDTHLMIGYEYMLIDKYSEAREYLAKAIILQPKEIKGYYNYGLSFQREEKYEDAIKAYDVLLKIDINHTPTLISMSRCYLFLGELDKSKAIIDKFFADKNFNPEMLMILAEINQKQGFLEQSANDYSRALVLLPDDTDLLNRLASIKGELGLNKEEEAIRLRVIDLYNSNKVDDETLSLEYGLLAVAQLANSSFSDAKENLDSAISFNKNKSNLYFYRSIAKAKLKDFEGGCNDLKKANEMNPEKADEYNEYFDDDIEFGEFQKMCFSIP
jgi:tetratricopeptide (TPR) repeat protein